MSLEKAIEHGKEHRKPYYKSGRFDRTCRAGGSCGYCQGNRMHSTKIRILIAEDTKEDVTDASIPDLFPKQDTVAG